MGCKYNIDEFKPFTSGGKKIIPTVANDWELQAKSYRTNDGVALYSPSLNTTIYDLDFRSFLNFLIKENVTMTGNKITGNFIIGQARVLRKESDYNETMSIKSIRTETIIPKKDYIIGATYETVCGEILTYLGERYIQTITNTVKGYRLSNIVKKQFAMGQQKYSGVQDVTNRKFVKMISGTTEDIKQVCENKLNNSFTNNYYITVSKTKKEALQPLTFIQDDKGHFVETPNGMVFCNYFNTYRDKLHGCIIYDDHLPGELTTCDVIQKQIKYDEYKTPTRYSIKRQ